jgi:hypothetical protein
MTIPLRITIDDTRAQNRFARLKNRFANFRPVMEGPVRQLVRRAIIEQFRTRGRWGNTPWPKLADSTIQKKRAAGVLRKGPLKFTSKLYQSLTVIGHPLRREKITKGHYQLRTMRRARSRKTGKLFPVGAAHQTGTSDGHVPARPIIPDPMPPSFMRELRSILRGHLLDVQFGPKPRARA